jgi:hypothetical protein
MKARCTSVCSPTLTFMKRAALALVTALALAGCAASPSYADHQFDSMNELRDVLAKAGVKCSSADDLAKTQISLAKYGFDTLPCDDSAGTVWGSESARADIQAKSWNALKPGYVLIEGANWSVMVAKSRVDEVNKTLKGTVKA